MSTLPNLGKVVAGLMRAVFPDSHYAHGKVEGVPVRVNFNVLAKAPTRDILAGMMGEKLQAAAEKDDRPIILVSRSQNREPLIHMTLDGFLTLVERYFYKRTEDADIIPLKLTKNGERTLGLIQGGKNENE